jgi:hypothetical protein
VLEVVRNGSLSFGKQLNLDKRTRGEGEREKQRI